MGFLSENQAEMMRFVDLWSAYVLEHDDDDWSRQQNIIINSSLKSARMDKKQYLQMMGNQSRRSQDRRGQVTRDRRQQGI